MPEGATTSPTNTAATDVMADGLPLANVKDPKDPFPDDQFDELRNIPVFAEHQTTAKDGRELRFGKNELEAIVHRCNRRINQTGDYAAITIGHTPSPDALAKGAKMPDLVGFAGPYRLGLLGNEGQGRRYAILADFHIFKDEMQRVRKHPRRSPEVWLEDDYEEMFFDPIAMLGAEAPRLDMGLLYCAPRHSNGRRRIVEKYTAVAPSAANVFVPDDDIREKKYQANPLSEDSSMALGPDEVRQIVDAIEQLDWVQGVKEMLQADQGGPGSLGQGVDEPNSDDLAALAASENANGNGNGNGMPPNGGELPMAPPENQEPERMNQFNENGNGNGMNGNGMNGNGMNGNGNANFVPPNGNGNGPVPPVDEEALAFNKRYQGDDEEFLPDELEDEDAKQYGSLGETTPEMLGIKELSVDTPAGGGGVKFQARRYGADDGVPEGEEIEVPLGDATVETGTKKYQSDDGSMFELDEEDEEELKSYMARKYGARKYGAGSVPAKEGRLDANKGVEGNEFGGTPGVEGSPASQSGDASAIDGTVADVPDEAASQYSRLSQQLVYTQRRLKDAEVSIGRERRARTNAERYSSLNDKRMNYVFDLDREMAMCQYSKMNPDQFAEHMETIDRNYQPIPVDTDLRVFSDAAIGSPDRPGGGKEAYSKDMSDRAYRICERKVLNGEHVEYEDVLQRLRTGRET
jgi:hypothetical protein